MRLLPLLLIVFLVSCGDDHADHEHAHHDHAHHDHGHVHHAAHGGTLVELGEHQANLELLHDSDAGTLTVYVYGPHAEKPIRIKDESIPAELTIGKEKHQVLLMAQASALSQETVGDSSTFQLTDEQCKTKSVIHIKIKSLSVLGHTFTDISAAIE